MRQKAIRLPQLASGARFGGQAWPGHSGGAFSKSVAPLECLRFGCAHARGSRNSVRRTGGARHNGAISLPQDIIECIGLAGIQHTSLLDHLAHVLEEVRRIKAAVLARLTGLRAVLPAEWRGGRLAGRLIREASLGRPRRPGAH